MPDIEMQTQSKHGISIETNRLIITPFNQDMAKCVHHNSLDEDNRRFIPDEVFETIEAASTAISYLIACYEKDYVPLVYPILLKSGEYIGHVQVSPLGKEWEIGYHIGKSYTGKGYATETVKAFLPVIMQHLDQKEMPGICHAGNIASRRVLDKCGFQLIFEGTGQLQGKEQNICRYRWMVKDHE